MVQAKGAKRLSVILMLGFALALVGCRVKQPQDRGVSVEQSDADRGDMLELLLSSQRGWDGLKATLRGEINLGKRSFSSRINLQAVRGEGIRLSVVPFPLIEAARVWFMPKHTIIVDLINGVYAEVAYSELSSKLGVALSYEQIESVLLAQVFNPEGGALTLDYLRSLGLKYTEGEGSLLYSKSKGSGYEFALTNTHTLRHYAHKDRRGARRFVASYDGRIELTPSTNLPQKSILTAYGVAGDLSAPLGKLSLEWQRVNAAERDELTIKPIIKPQYQKLTLDEVLKVIENL